MIKLAARMLPLSRETTETIARHLRAGAVIAFPTETLYGLGCVPSHRQAVARLVAIKKRPEGRPLPLIAADREAAAAAVRLDAAARIPWERLACGWPAPLTIVASAAPGPAAEVTAGTGEVGVRVSGLRLARQIARLAGGLIVATSANRSGAPPARTADAVAACVPGIDLLVDGGPVPGDLPSTVVRIGDPVMLVRAGAVSLERLEELLGAPLRP